MKLQICTLRLLSDWSLFFDSWSVVVMMEPFWRPFLSDIMKVLPQPFPHLYFHGYGVGVGSRAGQGVCSAGAIFTRRRQWRRDGKKFGKLASFWVETCIRFTGEIACVLTHTVLLRSETSSTIATTWQRSVKLHFKINLSIFIEQLLNGHSIDCT